MSDIGTRFRKFIDYKKGNDSYVKIAEKLGMSNQRMSNLFSGKEFGIKVIEVLMKEFPELNIRWLVLGQGEMLLKEYREKEEEQIRNDLSFRFKEIESIIPHLSLNQLKRISSGDLFSNEEIKKIKEEMST